MKAHQRRSFLGEDLQHPFGLHNLPYGCFARAGKHEPHLGTRVGETVIDLTELATCGLIDEVELSLLLQRSTWNEFIESGRDVWTHLRKTLQDMLDESNPVIRDDAVLREKVLVPIASVAMHLPVRIGDYTDFYASKEHAQNVGRLFRGPGKELNPNWLYLPVGYHGRASSVVISGTEIRRPLGQIVKNADSVPCFSPTRKLDFELEIGWIMGPGNPLGTSIPVEKASQHVFGMVIVNDWSARDIQQWEYVPLGPFLGKSFATSISPWIIPWEVVSDFRCEPAEQVPQPLAYLDDPNRSGLDIDLEVKMISGRSGVSTVITRANARDLYWSITQMIAHHTVNGCNLRSGDLLASGTISSQGEIGSGSLLERTQNGTDPLVLAGGEERAFLEDGDTIIMSGFAQMGNQRIGFGEVTGTIVRAPSS